MNPQLVEKIVQAVLYEGYNLYPYRPSIKSRRRWTFGTLYPESCPDEPSMMQAEVLVTSGTLQVELRFLQIHEQSIPDQQPWQDAVERQFTLPVRSIHDLLSHPHHNDFSFTATHTVCGMIDVSAQPAGDGFYRLTVRVTNRTTMGSEDPVTYALASTHLILTVRDGHFISMIDPPSACRQAVDACKNVGCFPVLVGQPPDADCLLCSPIILYDYPQIAPESPGDLFDSTEIDEILSLRILTLSDDEKAAAAAIDPRTSELIYRTESLARQQLMNLHGTMRAVGSMQTAAGFKPGDRVRLHPREGGDIMDIALQGKTATIAAVEQDYENRIHLAVTIDDDPGRDLGIQGKIAHRFFFRPDEVELIQGQGGVP